MLNHPSTFLPLTLIFLSYSRASLTPPTDSSLARAFAREDAVESASGISTGTSVSSPPATIPSPAEDVETTGAPVDLAVSAPDSQHISRPSPVSWSVMTVPLFTISLPTADATNPTRSDVVDLSSASGSDAAVSTETTASVMANSQVTSTSVDLPAVASQPTSVDSGPTASSDSPVNALVTSTSADDSQSTQAASEPVAFSTSVAAQDAVTSWVSIHGPIPLYASQNATPTSISRLNPTAQVQSTDSHASRQARKSALIAACLTLGMLSTLGICIFFMRCGLIARLRAHRRARRDSMSSQSEQGESPRSILREKTAIDLSPPPHDTVVLPVLPSLAHQPICPSPPPGVWSAFAAGPFEDVTHMLGPRADSRGSNGSGGSAAGRAESYATCDSRYSSPSSGRRSGESVPASLGSSRRSPSPPSEVLRTPDAPHLGAVLGRTPGQVVKFALQPSPASVPVLTLAGEGSEEWDVARSYGARSSGAESMLTVDAETGMDMETIQVGDKVCMLVQGR